MPNEQQFRALLTKILPDHSLQSASILKGGASAQTTLLTTLSETGKQKKFLVRQHGENDRRMNLNIARDEYRLLKSLQASEVSAPIPVVVDTDTFEFPCLILEYLEGTTSTEGIALEDVTQQMADALARIHCIPDAKTTFSYLPNQSMRSNYLLRDRATVDISLGEDIILEALKSTPKLPKLEKKSLLHGDYWENNVLWSNGKLIAVLDWEDSMLGNPLADVGDSRIAILWSYGEQAMHNFTQAYQALMPNLDYAHLPYWDLMASLRPLSQFSIWVHDYHEATMRQQHRWFIEQAIDKLG